MLKETPLLVSVNHGHAVLPDLSLTCSCISGGFCLKIGSIQFSQRFLSLTTEASSVACIRPWEDWTKSSSMVIGPQPDH